MAMKPSFLRFLAIICAFTLTFQITPRVSAAEAEETMFSAPYNLYFGLMHAHTDLSDGQGTMEEAFSHAAAVEDLDFFAVTDHSNSPTPEEWAAGFAAAETVTNEEFLGLFGYEMTWPEESRIGHIVALGTRTLLSRDQAEFANPATGLEAYYQALTKLPNSVSMFCHPGKRFGDFQSFGHYTPDYDDRIHLLEVASGEEASSWDQYGKALDSGWHLAPAISQNNHNGLWGDADQSRTVILTDDLTEASLLEAIRKRRVYATEDRNLHLYWELDGCPMGGILHQATRPEILLSAWDPDGEAIGTIEVIAEGGQVLSTQTASESDIFISISPGSGFRYCYLQITQPDGQRAVTAPVWIEEYKNIVITDFSSDSPYPVQDQELTLSVTVTNRERVPFLVEILELYADNQLVYTEYFSANAEAQSSLTLTVPYTHPLSGETVLKAMVWGSYPGCIRSCEAELPLRFRSGVTLTGVLVDGNHENTGLDRMDRLCVLTEEADLDLTLITEDLPQGGDLLLIPDPQTPLEDSFLRDVRSFAESGGDLILWGTPEILRPLLNALEVTLHFQEETVKTGSAETFNSSDRCRDLVSGQYFSHSESYALDAGQGTWLVRKGTDGPVLLACEQTRWGGTVFLSGSAFLLDDHMPEAVSIWDLPRANETIFRAILGNQQEILAVKSIHSVRHGTVEELYRIKGYVTAGTSNPHTTFPDTVYLQDDTGGIAVTGFSVPDIQIGQPMEIIGTLVKEGDRISLEYRDYRLVSESFYRYVPGTISCESAMDYPIHGGQLVQVEGRVRELTKTEDRKGIRSLVISDFRGGEAVIEIEEGICSGATGENTLTEEIRKGRTVRVMGFVHINEAGETVIRVRNCDEVVYVPPVTDVSNPDTGDRFWRLLYRIFH